jgi:hypothetical protein
VSFIKLGDLYVNPDCIAYVEDEREEGFLVVALTAHTRDGEPAFVHVKKDTEEAGELLRALGLRLNLAESSGR